MLAGWFALTKDLEMLDLNLFKVEILIYYIGRLNKSLS